MISTEANGLVPSRAYKGLSYGAWPSLAFTNEF